MNMLMTWISNARIHKINHGKMSLLLNHIILSEWVSDCCLTPIQQFFLALSWWGQVNFQWDDDKVCFVLDQHAELDFHSASSLKQQSAGRHDAPLWTHYSDSEPTSLCSFFLMLHTKQKGNKYQYHSLRFDPIWARTHNLPHSRRAC
jgi:hypothetical protein